MNYSYQVPAAKSVLSMALSGQYKAAVLGAAPNAGKSTIIIHVINSFLNQFPNAKVVVLTHNQNVLRDQMLEGFEDGFVKPNFTYGGFGSNTQVEVGIPSSRSKISKIDLLVVDEAHHYYGASMLEEVITTHKPMAQILMTGSPGIYNKANKEAGKTLYGMYYISGEELVEQDVYSDVVIDVAQVVSANVIEQYKTAFGKLSQDSRFNASKLMIACKTVNDAYVLGMYLKSSGRNVAISTSDNDKCNEQIKRFKKGEADALIVVNKGILGFSDNNVTALIDLKCSKDIDARNQLFARIFRKHPQGIKKFYVSVATKQNYNDEVKTLYSVANLMKKSSFQNYIK